MSAVTAQAGSKREGGSLLTLVPLVMAAALVVGAAVHPSVGRIAAPIAIVLAGGTALRHHLLRWRTLLGAVVLCILFIPMRRYSMPGHLPFQLEPYRLVVAFVTFAWVSSLLIDRRIRLRRCGLERPLGMLLLACIASDVVNAGSINRQGLNSYVIKAFTFTSSFIIVLYIVLTLIRTQRDLDWLIKLLVGAGGFVALSAVVEDRTRFNIFNHLHTIVPILRFAGLSYHDLHDDRVRAMASAEHPIALGAGLVLLIPLGLYLVKRTGEKRWIIASALLVLGALSSRSRTPMMMLIVMGLVFLWLRPRQVRRYAPALVPIALAAQLAMPGLTSTLVHAFFPKGGIVAQQDQTNVTYGSGRVATLVPGLKQWLAHPAVGTGFGARISDRTDPHVNAMLLDDQWLGTLIETGFLGVVAWVWLFGRMIRRLARAAKREAGPAGLLYVGVAGSIAAYAESMTTYDAFAFTQEVFILFLVIAIGCVALLQSKESAAAEVPAAAPAPLRMRPSRAGTT